MRTCQLRIVVLLFAAIILTCAGQADSKGSDHFVADPDANGDLSPWDHIQVGGTAYNVADHSKGFNDAGGSISIVTDPLSREGKVYKLMVTPSSNFASSVAPADRVDLWNNARSYTGTEGQETWEHFRVMFPSAQDSYKAAPGNWNWIVQHHNDSKYKAFVDSGAIQPERPELAIGIDTGAKLRNGKQAPELFMDIRGGDDKHQGPDTKVYAGAPLLYDHWYDMLIHLIWSHDQKKGLVEWWLDGNSLYSQHVANLWQRPDGTIDHVNFEFSNYRVHANWNSTVYFSKVKIGPRRDDVSF